MVIELSVYIWTRGAEKPMAGPPARTSIWIPVLTPPLTMLPLTLFPSTSTT